MKSRNVSVFCTSQTKHTDTQKNNNKNTNKK